MACRTVQNIFRLATFLLTLWVIPANAEVPRQMNWPDLIPKSQPIENPLKGLTSEQRRLVGMVAEIEKLKTAKRSISSFWLKDAEENRKKLESQGVDVDALLPKLTKTSSKIARSQAALVDTLDGQLIRMPGYLLPLEFSGTMTTEFLLVPFVGACIHVPPPPPNQIVHVRLDKPFKTDSLYTPVQITGRISAKRDKKPLFLEDGQADVPIGYSMDGGSVELYKK